MNDCIFCKIRDGVIPSEILYEDEDVFVIRDIEPKAKLHYLMIPKRHFKLFDDMTEEDERMLGRAMKKISELKGRLGLENGYRVIVNQGEDAGQTVFHLHIHILGGEILSF